MSDDKESRDQLASKISRRLVQDDRWARLDFSLAQLFLWLAILASFVSAALAAADTIPKLWLALLAAIPGTVIVVDKSFSFAKRARWHWEMSSRLERLLLKLQFEGKSVAEVAAEYGDLRVEMEDKFPGMSAEGVADSSVKKG